MTPFLTFILAVSAVGVVADLIVLSYLLSAREKAVRVWGRLGALAYHLAVAAWSAFLVAGA